MNSDDAISVLSPRAVSQKDAPLVTVEWVDSHRDPDGWRNFEDFPPPKPMRCRSVGWLVYGDEDCLVLVPHLGENQGCGTMTIPRLAVLHVKRLDGAPETSEDRPASPLTASETIAAQDAAEEARAAPTDTRP